MKIVALAVLLAVMQTAPPVPRKAPDNPAQTAAQVKNKGTPSQTESLPAPTTIKADADGPAKTDSSEQHPADTEHTVGISKLPSVTVNPAQKDWSDWAYWCFNLLLVVVGGLQTLVLVMQWRLFKRQTILQEVGFFQWIELHDWKVERQVRGDSENVLDVSFGIYNPTKYPITLQFISVDVNWQKTNLNLPKILPPNRSTFVSVSLSITPEQNRLRQESSLSLFVEGYVEFINVLKTKQSYPFRGGIVCNRTQAGFIDRTIPPTKEQSI